MAAAIGGCMCGAVRYECTATPMFMGNCHCRDCQRASGGTYAPAIGVREARSRLQEMSNITSPKPTAGIWLDAASVQIADRVYSACRLLHPT
jgi:hypothetical protein